MKMDGIFNTLRVGRETIDSCRYFPVWGMKQREATRGPLRKDTEKWRLGKAKAW